VRRTLLVILLVLLHSFGAIPAHAQTPESAPDGSSSGAPNGAPVLLTVRGQVSSGSSGVTVPPNIPVTLQLIDAQGTPRSVEATIDAAGAFTFTDVPAISGEALIVSTTFQGVPQSTPVLEVPASADTPNVTVDVPLVLFGTTNDPSVITIVAAQHWIDVVGDQLQMVSIYMYRNVSDRLYFSATGTADGRLSSFSVPLPIGANSIAFGSATIDVFDVIYLNGDINQPVVFDTRAVLPGPSYTALISYLVPYSRAATIDQEYPYSTEALQLLIANDSGLALTGADFTRAENVANEIPTEIPTNGTPQTSTQISPENQRNNYTQYIYSKPIPAGTTVIYTLEGQRAPTPVPNLTPRDSGGIGFLFAVLGGLIVIIGLVVMGLRMATNRGRSA
jgi:hypothetical protein